MLEEISEIMLMVVPISLIVATDSWVAACIPAIWVLISSVALAVWAASALTSEATTAKPRPASPARARFDRSIQRQQVGLFGDGGDQLHHVTDASRSLREFGNAGVGLLSLTHGVVGDAAGSPGPDG